MKEQRLVQFFILIYWTSFGALTVVDKIIPDVYPLWVGADFYTLFIKFFASLGLSNPLFATVALAGVSAVEAIAFTCYLFSLFNLFQGKDQMSEQWFYRGISVSVLLFSFFSIGDQVFGDRFTLLEHGVFWILLMVSWAIFKFNSLWGENRLPLVFTRDLKLALLTVVVLTLASALSMVHFSRETFHKKTAPVVGIEVAEHVYKFDMPFLSDKTTVENTLAAFMAEHPELAISYLYTGPDELNSKKKTHMLLYVFMEPKGAQYSPGPGERQGP